MRKRQWNSRAGEVVEAQRTAREDARARRVEELRGGEGGVSTRRDRWARQAGALTVTMPPSERVKNSSTVGPMPSSASEREEGEAQSHEFVVGAARRTRPTDRL